MKNIFLVTIFTLGCFSNSGSISALNKALGYLERGRDSDVDSLIALVEGNEDVFRSNPWVEYKDNNENNFLHLYAKGSHEGLDMAKLFLAKGVPYDAENIDTETPESLFSGSVETFYAGVVKDYQGVGNHEEMGQINTDIISEADQAIADIDAGNNLSHEMDIINTFVKDDFFTTDQIDNILSLIVYLRRIVINNGDAYTKVSTKFGALEAISILNISATKIIFDGDTDKFKGTSLMHMAAHYGRVEAIKILSWAGVDIDIETNTDNIDPLTHNPLKTPLEFAIDEEEHDAVQELLRLGADGDVVIAKATHPFLTGVEAYYPDTMTYLHFAIFVDDYNLAEALINGGANINAQDSAGNTPLHLIRLRELNDGASGQTNLKNFILNRGADQTIANNDGKKYADLDENYADSYFNPA